MPTGHDTPIRVNDDRVVEAPGDAMSPAAAAHPERVGSVDLDHRWRSRATCITTSRAVHSRVTTRIGDELHVVGAGPAGLAAAITAAAAGSAAGEDGGVASSVERHHVVGLGGATVRLHFRGARRHARNGQARDPGPGEEHLPAVAFT